MASIAYITVTDLLTRDSATDLANLTGGNGTVYVQTAIDAVILTAQAEIDSYIGLRVRLPLLAEEQSQAVKSYTTIVARYYLYGDRKTQAVIDEYDQAIRWLRDVAGGRASCGVVQAAEPGATVQGTVIVAPTRTRTFGDAFEAAYSAPMGANGSGSYTGRW